MKTIWSTMVVWLLTVAACYGQDLQQMQQNTLELLERKRAAAEQRQASLEAGRAIFGADERWTEDRKGGFAGTLRKAPTDFRIGDWGCTNAQFEVRGVVSNTECLVLPDYRKAEPMLIRGLDMAKVTDGAKFILQHPVVIQDTYSYRAVSGAQKRVLVLEVNETKLAKATAQMRAAAEVQRFAEIAKQEANEIERQRIEEANEAERRRIEEAKRRTWISGQFKVEAEFLTAIGGKVRLKRRDNGKEITVPMELLSKEDQEFILERKWLERPATAEQPPKIETPSAGRFVGRWRIVNDEGVTGAYFSLTASYEAKKDHAPDVTAKWEIVGNDARITWSDGWRDLLRAQQDKTLVLVFRPGTSWDDPPYRTDRAIRE